MLGPMDTRRSEVVSYMSFSSQSQFSGIILVKVEKSCYTGHLSIGLIKLECSETWASVGTRLHFQPQSQFHHLRCSRRLIITNIRANDPSRYSGNSRRKLPGLMQAFE